MTSEQFDALLKYVKLLSLEAAMAQTHGIGSQQKVTLKRREMEQRLRALLVVEDGK